MDMSRNIHLKIFKFMNRTKIINILSSKINANSYLEIGVRIADENFNKINVGNKIGVDPGIEGCSEGTHTMTSDEFFEQNLLRVYCIFVILFYRERCMGTEAN